MKAGKKTTGAGWGHDARNGILTLQRGKGTELETTSLANLAGNYPAYYAAVRDAIQGRGENPVSASDAIEVMELIEIGVESAKLKRVMSLRNSAKY